MGGGWGEGRERVTEAGGVGEGEAGGQGMRGPPAALCPLPARTPPSLLVPGRCAPERREKGGEGVAIGW